MEFPDGAQSMPYLGNDVMTMVVWSTIEAKDKFFTKSRLFSAMLLQKNFRNPFRCLRSALANEHMIKNQHHIMGNHVA